MIWQKGILETGLRLHWTQSHIRNISIWCSSFSLWNVVEHVLNLSFLLAYVAAFGDETSLYSVVYSQQNKVRICKDILEKISSENMTHWTQSEKKL